MPRRIKIKKLYSIGLVDKGASGDAENRPEIVIFKRCGTEPHLIKKQEGTAMGLDEILAGLPEEQRNVILAALEEAKKQPEPEAEMEAKADDEEEMVAKAMKQLPESVREHFEVIAKRNDELSKRIDELNEREVERIYIAKAAKYDAVGIEQKKLASMLRQAGDGMSKENFEAFEGFLGRTNMIAKRGFGEIGSAGDASEPNGSDQIEIIAKRLREADPKLSHAVSMLRASEQLSANRKRQ